MFYNCPEIVDEVDSPLVDNRLGEELVAGIAEVEEGYYNILGGEEGDILIRLVLGLIDGRKHTPYWEEEEEGNPVAPTEGEGVCSRFVGGVHRLDIGSRTC